MNKKITTLVLLALVFSSLTSVKAADQSPSFRIMTESGVGDYIGQNKPWDFSTSSNSKISVTNADESKVAFKVEDFNVSYMMFEFGSEVGKKLSQGGLFTPAKRFAFRDSYNGIDVGGDGRGCNTILGSFYVHEYVIASGTLQKAAIDFVQTCEPNSADMFNSRPKLFGSLRYNSSIPDSCNGSGCADVKTILGFKPDLTINDIQTVSDSGKLYLNFGINNTGIATQNGQIVSVKAVDLDTGDVYTSGYSNGLAGMKTIISATPLVAKSTGIYRLGATIDNVKIINESNENNNDFEKTITIIDNPANKPDLIVDAINFTGAKKGEKGTLSVSIKNLGGNLTSSTGLLNYYSNFSSQLFTYSATSSNGVAGERLMNRALPSTADPLKTNETIVFSWYGYFDTYGPLYIHFTVDDTKLLDESNENNNTLTTTIAIKNDTVVPTYTGFEIKPTKSLFQSTDNLTVNLRAITIANSPYLVDLWASKDVSIGEPKKYKIQSNVPVGNVDYLTTNDIDQMTVFREGGNGSYTLVTCPPSGCAMGVTNAVGVKIEGFQDVFKPDLVTFKPIVTELSTVHAVIECKVDGITVGVNPAMYLGTSADSLSRYHSLEVLNRTNSGFGIKSILTSLKPNTTYYYRLILNESSVTEVKDIVRSFKTVSESGDQNTDYHNNANRLVNDKMSEILSELKQLRDLVKEQSNKIKYLEKLTDKFQNLSDKMETALNNFITYGVDTNTQKLGTGERAAVISSYKSAYNKLPETEAELADAIKIASGRWPGATSASAEKRAKAQFEKIYKRIPDMNNANDNAAVTVMAYGLRQKAESRNMSSESNGIKTFKTIYGKNPSTTNDWNTMQAITYSGASRGKDSDGDLLTDDREKELGTNPNNKDTDGDGFGDGVEVANGYNPLKK